MSKGNRIREWLGGLFRHVPRQDCDKTMICLKTDCVNNEFSRATSPAGARG